MGDNWIWFWGIFLGIWLLKEDVFVIECNVYDEIVWWVFEGVVNVVGEWVVVLILLIWILVMFYNFGEEVC